LASVRPQKIIRARTNLQIDAWVKAAKVEGLSFNDWACASLDRSARGEVPPKREVPAPTVKARSNATAGCPADTPRGTKCKFCGKEH
jgi:hypothetical protein